MRFIVPLAYITLLYMRRYAFCLVCSLSERYTVNMLIVQRSSRCKRSMRVVRSVRCIVLATLPEWRRGCGLAYLYLMYTL